MKRLTMLAAALAALALGVPAARAADVSAPIPGHPGVTGFDLMRLVVTDLQPDAKGATGHTAIALSHIAGKDAGGDPPADITLTSIDVAPMADDPSRVLVLADLGPSEGFVSDAVVLALFDVGGSKPRLLDVAAVGTDRFVYFREQKAPMLARRAPLILIDSGHDNSDQSYVITEMMFVRGDRLRLIDTVFTFGDRTCAYKRTQEPYFTTSKGRGPYADIHVRVEEVVTAEEPDCGEEKALAPHKREFRGTWRWDARRKDFTGGSRALTRLEKQNAKVF